MVKRVFWIAILHFVTVSIETDIFPTADTTRSLKVEECYRDDLGVSYRGFVAKTITGRTCQEWSSQTPHTHDKLRKYPNSGLERNYCRNMGYEIKPWCYTTDRNKRWEYCPVQRCSGTGYIGRIDDDRPKPIKTNGSCRHEDFMFWSKLFRTCRWTRRIYYLPEAREINLTSCNDDEFECSSPFRCIPRYYLNTELGCSYNNTMRTIVPCRDNEFMCEKTRRCVPRWAIADMVNDCNDFLLDDSIDETRGPFRECLRNEYRCESTGRCIPREWVLDGDDDCPGKNNVSSNSDESAPLQNCYDDTEFTCLDTGRCLSRYRVMDGYNDCADLSDEIQPLAYCTKAEFRCQDTGRCIPRSWVMDSRNNCRDGSDEIQQENVTCIDTEFPCHDGRRCIPEMYRCDGMQHCGDCSDEIEGCETPTMWRCPGHPSICFPHSHACDAFSHCPGRADTMSFLPGFKCDSRKTEESQVTCAVPQWMLHDDLSVCSDQSDLCFVEGEFKCSLCADWKTIISNKQICNDVLDCRDLWDECLCPKTGNISRIEALCKSVCYGNSEISCENCLLGEIYCEKDGKCINKERLCDGTVDCPKSQLDETFCTKPGENLAKSGGPEKSYHCQPIPPKLISGLTTLNALEALRPYMPENAARCDGILECVFFDDECNSDCQTRLPVCDDIPEYKIDFETLTGYDEPINLRGCKDFDHGLGNIDILLGSMICNGIQDCSGGEDELNCADRHYCNAGKVQWFTGERMVINIHKTRVCDGKIDCIDDASDERNCPNKTHFYCYNKNPLFIRQNQVMDGKQDCEDNSDECPKEYMASNTFSSPEEMIRIGFLRYFIWIMATLAILGNIGVFVETLIIDKRTKLTPMSKCNRTLILNLAASDFFMGIALLMIGIKSSLSSGSYCMQDDAWRTSGLCDAIGILVAISCETSVFTLALLTCYRLYGVYRPFASRHVKMKKVFILMAITWMVAGLIAVIPVFPGIKISLVTQVLIKPSRYFTSTRVSSEEMQRFVTRSIALGNVTGFRQDILRGWSVIEQLGNVTQLKDYVPEILGYFGFYSTDGVCIPRFFKGKGSPPLHPLSIVIVILNFCSLLFIIISYIMIYKESSSGRANVRKNDAQEKKNQAMQRKITILIGTDLCCWLPICILSFVSQAGIHLPRDAYAVAAIVLLPINSSINPFIYSNGFESIRNFVKGKFTSRQTANVELPLRARHEEVGSSSPQLDPQRVQ